MGEPAAIYIRVSTRDQVEGHSLPFQLEDCRRAAAAAGYEVASEYVDAGISGTKTTGRDAFQECIADGKAGKWKALFVWKWERFARNREDSIVYKNLLRRAGVKVLSATEPGGGDGHADVLIEGVLETVAEWYSIDLSHKVSRSRQRRAELGLYNGDLPFGYARHPDSTAGNPLPPVVVESEAALVRMLFEQYSCGAVSMAELARAMNQAGARTRNTRKVDKFGHVGPRPWTKESVKDTLGNPFYRGVVSYRSELHPGKHVAIVSDALWAKVDETRKLRRHGGSTYTPAYRRYPLKGLARCVQCGEKLWANSAKSGTYYRDPASVRGLDCIGGSAPTHVIDRQIDALVSRLVLPDHWRDEVSVQFDRSGEAERVERERARLTERKRRVARAYQDEMRASISSFSRAYSASVSIRRARMSSLYFKGPASLNYLLGAVSCPHIFYCPS